MTPATFSKIYGIKKSFIDTFMLYNNIKGPCWLQINKFTKVTTFTSWCQMEVACSYLDNIKNISNCNLAPPPLVALTLSLRTLPNPETGNNEIVMLSSLVQRNFRLDAQNNDFHFDEDFCGKFMVISF